MNADFGARYAQANAVQNLAKPFTALKLQGKIDREVYSYKKVGERVLGNGQVKPIYRRVKEMRKEDAGHIVKFPGGHSVHVREKLTEINGQQFTEMEAQGFNKEPGLVDVLTGDIVVPNRDKMAESLDLMTLIPQGYEAAKANAKGGK